MNNNQDQQGNQQSPKPEEMKWIVKLPHSWGTGDGKSEAFQNSLTHWNEYGIERDQITMWIAKIHKESLEVTMHGEVFSQSIQHQEEVDIDPENLKKFKELDEDLEALQHSLLSGEFEIRYPKTDLDQLI
jgi:hypothetical protein